MGVGKVENDEVIEGAMRRVGKIIKHGFYIA